MPSNYAYRVDTLAVDVSRPPFSYKEQRQTRNGCSSQKYEKENKRKRSAIKLEKPRLSIS